MLRVLLLFVTIGCLTPVLLAAETPPNIVMLISDDQKWDDYGFMGHEHIRTPHLDKLAKESAVFRHGYVPTSLCRPSLMTLITGYYPHEHGVTGNDPARGVQREAMLRHIRRANALPEMLAKKGYVSHQSGKWWEGAPAEAGFTAGMTHGDPKRGGRHGDLGLKVGRDGIQPIRDFLAENKGKPFFLWYAPFLPHTPHNPPEKYLSKYSALGLPVPLAKYYAMCEWFDATCGEVLAELDAQGVADNTLVVYVTDNGWIQKTTDTKIPNGWRQPFAPRSKRAPQDGGVRTPIMFKWPKHIQPADHEEYISSVDLVPTILAAAGLDVPESLPGLNLLPGLTGGEMPTHDAIYGEIFTHDVVDQDKPSDSLLYRWVIQDGWKLIEPAEPSEALRSSKTVKWLFDLPEGTKPELYKIEDDPYEENNLYGKHPDITKKLRATLNEWYPQ